MDYLRNRRGFSEETIAKFRMGYAPANNGLRAWLASKNVSEQDMGDLGLVSLAEHNTSKRTFDFFRDRVMIPIFDKAGRPIAFGGRVMGDAQPKYLNSPETPIFQKRRILYNMNYARDKAFEAKNLLICEGYMDVIALDAYGIGYAVAPLGTALTEDQIQETWRVCSEPVCCFDGDGAGVRAAMRSVDRVLPILKPGYSLRFLFLPDKQDPDQGDGGENPQDQKPDQGKGGAQQERMSREEAERMLDAVQGSEDNTKKKVDGRKARAVGRSGKNW